MPEVINPLTRQNPEVILWNAMCAVVKDDQNIIDMFKIQYPPHDPDAGTVSVQVLVNGVEVPFIDSVKKGLETLMGSFDEAVLDKAKELITEQPTLLNLQSKLSEADWAINEALEAVLKSRETR